MAHSTSDPDAALIGVGAGAAILAVASIFFPPAAAGAVIMAGQVAGLAAYHAGRKVERDRQQRSR